MPTLASAELGSSRYTTPRTIGVDLVCLIVWKVMVARVPLPLAEFSKPFEAVEMAHCKYASL